MVGFVMVNSMWVTAATVSCWAPPAVDETADVMREVERSRESDRNLSAV